jgi:hypothetical protein
MRRDRSLHSALLLGLFLVLALVGCSAHHDEVSSPEPAKWTCEGRAARWRTDKAIAGVQVIVRGTRQTVSDSAGRYIVTLGAERNDVSSIRFTKQDYVDVIAMLDSATVIGEQALHLDVIMLTEKENH